MRFFCAYAYRKSRTTYSLRGPSVRRMRSSPLRFGSRNPRYSPQQSDLSSGLTLQGPKCLGAVELSAALAAIVILGRGRNFCALDLRGNRRRIERSAVCSWQTGWCLTPIRISPKQNRQLAGWPLLARGEESPGSMKTRCRITSGGGDPRESATESKPPQLVCGKGERVR